MNQTSSVIALFLIPILHFTAHAGVVRFDGDLFPPVPLGGIGTIEVRFDLDPPDAMNNGGVDLGIQHDNLGLIEFVSAEVVDVTGRWTFGQSMVNDNLVEFFAASILTPALPRGGQDVLFATINYRRIGVYGVSNLSFVVGEEALVDGRDFGTIVTQNYSFQPNFVAWVPEPTTLAMASLGLIGLLLRRRNG